VTSFDPHLYEGYVEFGCVRKCRLPHDNGTKNGKAVLDGACLRKPVPDFHELRFEGQPCGQPFFLMRKALRICVPVKPAARRLLRSLASARL